MAASVCPSDGNAPDYQGFPGRVLIGIGIVDPQPRQYLGFQPFHVKGFCLIEVIIPQNVEKSMHH